MIVRGLRRLAVVLGVAVALSAGVGVALGALRDTDTWVSLSHGFYIGGAVCVIGAMFSRPLVGAYGEFGGVDDVRDSFNARWIFLGVGLVLVALGIVCETQVVREPPGGPPPV